MNDLKVLIIEHDPEALLMLQCTLQEQGIEVYAAHDFIEAARFLRSNRPSLIISDLLWKEKTTGLDFYSHHVVAKKIPFALVSDTFQSLSSKASYTKDPQNPHLGTLTFSEQGGSIPCFVKPFDPSDILNHFPQLFPIPIG